MTRENTTYQAFGRLYLNITNRCSARCVFCIRNTCDGVFGYNLRLTREPSEEEMIETLERLPLSQFQEVVFTGFGEPTCRLDAVLRITAWLHQKGAIVRLDTNGHAVLLNPGRDVVAELKTAGLDCVSVSLNAESEENYNRLCRPLFQGAYRALLDFTKNAVRSGIQTRVTVVKQEGVDMEACKALATALGASFKVRG